METKWSDFGFLGSLLLVFYGILSLLIYYTPPSLFGFFAPSIAGGRAVLGILAALCFSFGFHAIRTELNAPSPWLTYFTLFFTIATWVYYGASQVLVSLGLTIGLVYWYFSVYGLMVAFLFWGLLFFYIRTRLGRKSRFALSASLLFLINGIGWLSFMGFGILALGAFLCLFIYAPATKYSPFSPIIRFFNNKRIATIRYWGAFSLIIYSLLGMKWVINGFLPLPAAAAAVFNLLSLLLGGITVLGNTLALRAYERHYESPTFWYAQLIWIPGMLLALFADFQWLMSNITVFIAPVWGLVLYSSVIFLTGWCSLFLAIFAFIAAIAFLQIYRWPEHRGETLLLFLHLSLLASGFLWLTIALSLSGLLAIIPWLFYYLGLSLLSIFSIGFLGFCFTGVILWRQWLNFSNDEP